MFPSELHYVYLLIGKNGDGYTLLNEKNIKKIYDAFEALGKFINPKEARISAIQLAKDPQSKKGKEGYKSYRKIGRVKWTLDDLRKLCTAYKDYPNGEFNFTHFIAEFPSVSSAYNKGTSPKITLQIENDTVWGKEYGSMECGLVLSLREDIFNEIGERAIFNFLQEVNSLLGESKILFIKRTFWRPSRELASVMDITPWRYKDDKRYFQEWKKIDL